MNSVIPQSLALSLQQSLSISNNVLKSAFVDFQNNPNTGNSRKEFIQFCMARFTCNKPVLSPDWRPSSIDFAGIPIKIIMCEFLPLFMINNAGKHIPADYDLCFQEFCVDQWNLDCRNSKAEWGTFMKKGWEPSVIIKDRIYECFNIEECEILIAEFRLYWIDAGQSSIDWEDRLLKWVNRSACS